MQKIGIVGLIFTTLYLVFVLSISVPSHRSFEGLNPNGWGDFFAGMFGPLAILWLVLGYFQQGRELKNSVDALNLQARELKDTAVRQAELVIENQRLNQFESEKFFSDGRRDFLRFFDEVEVALGRVEILLDRVDLRMHIDQSGPQRAIKERAQQWPGWRQRYLEEIDLVSKSFENYCRIKKWNGTIEELTMSVSEMYSLKIRIDAVISDLSLLAEPID